MLVLEVFLEEVASEVVVEVAPDEVGVVGVVLGVGVFDEEVVGLDAEVVGFSGFEGAGPREVCGGELVAVEAEEEVALVGGDGFDEFEELVLDGVGEFVVGDAFFGEGLGGAVGAGDDFAGGFVGVADVEALAVELAGEFAGGVFNEAEGAESFVGSVGDFGGVGAEEEGGGEGGFVFFDGEIEGEVVAFVAEAPDGVWRGVAEDGEVVFVGVAEFVLVGFLVEVGFEFFDLFGGEGALFTEGEFEEVAEEAALHLGELVEADAFAVFGEVVPVFAFFGVEGEVGELFLLGVEDFEECCGGEGVFGGLGEEGEGEGEEEEDVFHGFEDFGLDGESRERISMEVRGWRVGQGGRLEAVASYPR